MTPEITQLLDQLRAGDRAAFNTLVSLLYDELHRIAEKHLRQERTSHTLQTTALVNEAYMKITESRQCDFNDRAHFLAVASRVMRQVLVDYARAKTSPKRSTYSTKNQAAFGWMTAEETAEALGRSVHIIRQDLRLAQAWLRRRLQA